MSIKIKDKFELIYSRNAEGKSEEIKNVLPIKKFTLKAYETPKEDYFHLTMLASAFARTHKGEDIVGKYIKQVGAVHMKEYPLPGFVTKDGDAYINTAVLPGTYVSDYSSPDIYAMFLYVIALKSYITKNPFEPEVENHIAEFYIQTFMNLFGKKYGLTGAYKTLIPELQVLIACYVKSGIMGIELTEEILNKISNKFYINASSINIPKDINTTNGFLKALKTNNIIPLSENKFSTTIINCSGISSLPMFETGDRLFATILASSVSGNTIFSKFWRKKQAKIYEKLLNISIVNAKRGLSNT